MGLRGRDAIPDRGEERSSPRERRVARNEPQTTFRPSLGLYVASPFLLILGGFPWYAAFQTGEFDFRGLAFGGLAIFAGLYVLVNALTRYRIDVDGIEVWSKGKRRYWRWAEIGGVRGAQLQSKGGYGLSQIVVDHEDQILFRLSPWTAKRRVLATQIRRRAADARDQAPPLPTQR